MTNGVMTRFNKKSPKTGLKRLEKSDIADNYPTYRIFTVEEIFSEAVTKLDKRRIIGRKKFGG